MHIFLETRRLLLRRFTRDDADLLVALDRDPGVMRFLDGRGSTPREVVVEEVLPRFLRCYEQFSGLGFWAAVEKETGTFAGWFELRPHEGGALDDVELGYRMRTAVWGRGLATEGSRALVRKAFTEFGVRRVHATTMVVNSASRRVMEKAGLGYVRTFFEDRPDAVEGAEFGDVEYELLRADWQREQQASGGGGAGGGA
jgi:RimJ/RimL family protein N-acetyltransferase